MDFSKLHLHWRESAHKGKKYRSYSLARAYREDGKNKKEIVFKLGKLDDDSVSKWRDVLALFKDRNAAIANLNDVEVVSHKAFLDVALASSLWDEWELDSAFPGKGKRLIDLAAVAKVLTINRCLDPLAKSNVAKWFGDTVLAKMCNISQDHFNSSRVFRDLTAIEDCKEQLCAHIFARLRRHHRESLSHAFYDLSTSLFHGTKCSLVKWGRSKDGYDNHYIIALLVNKDGIPFYWEVVPGSTSDIKMIDPLSKRLEKSFPGLSTTLVFDRGFVSSSNLSSLESKGIKYVTALDKSQIESRINFDLADLHHLNTEKVQFQIKRRTLFKWIDDQTYYRDIPCKNPKRRYILVFNPTLFTEQREMRAKALERFKQFVETLNDALLVAVKNDRDHFKTYTKFKNQILKEKLSGFVGVKLKEKNVKFIDDFQVVRIVRSYQATVEVDQAQMRHAGRLDGMWMIVTNEVERNEDKFSVSSIDIIKSYRDKHIIESSFRDIKSFVNLKPAFVWTAKHVQAHYTICVLAHLLRRSLSKQLSETKTGEDKEVVSAEECFSVLKKCQLNAVQIHATLPPIQTITRPNSQQKNLLTRIGHLDLISSAFINKIKD